jgi:hypothetical protein
MNDPLRPFRTGLAADEGCRIQYRRLPRKNAGVAKRGFVLVPLAHFGGYPNGVVKTTKPRFTRLTNQTPSQSVAVSRSDFEEGLENAKTMKCNDLYSISGLAGSKTGQSGCFRPFVQSFPTSQFQPSAVTIQ